MNIKLLQKVKQVILEEPRRLDMDIGISITGGMRHELEHACGTVACVAGWTVLIDRAERLKCPYLEAADRSSRFWQDIRVSAEHLLGINYTQMIELAYAENWPTDLYNKYETCALRGNQEGMAKATAERIDRFIEQYK